MTHSRRNHAKWFTIPAVATAGVLTAISIPELEDIRQEIGSDSLAEPLIALVIFAGVGGMIVGSISYGLRRLTKRHEA